MHPALTTSGPWPLGGRPWEVTTAQAFFVDLLGVDPTGRPLRAESACLVEAGRPDEDDVRGLANLASRSLKPAALKQASRAAASPGRPWAPSSSGINHPAPSSPGDDGKGSMVRRLTPVGRLPGLLFDTKGSTRSAHARNDRPTRQPARAPGRGESGAWPTFYRKDSRMRSSVGRRGYSGLQAGVSTAKSR